ncbi:MAG TPA: M13 family metallopeptidase [Saprospiraceae bacterium]|nr:M13 family metallopeptidase [Saprospiraceae bacterium]
MARGINRDNLDLEMSPERDFYQFVNGGWMKRTEIPSDRSSWGSFHELAKKTDEKNIELLVSASSEDGKNEDNKATVLFQTGMDTKCIEREKLRMLKRIFKDIREGVEKSNYSSLLGSLISKGLGGILHFSVHPDLGNSHIYAAYLEPGNQGLPDRDFYLEESEQAENIREHYLKYVTKLFHTELDYPLEIAEEISKQTLSLEKDLAKHMLSKEDRRQMDKLYNPYTPEELQALCPVFDWKDFFEAMNITPPGRIIVTEPDYFRHLNEVLKTIRATTIENYLTFLTLHHAAPFVHASLENIHFDLYHRLLEGVEQMKPRKERIVKIVNQNLGDALGQLFVLKYFPAEAKYTALEMVDDIVTAFNTRIQHLEWMTNETKKYATEKLAALRVKIGFPDKWKEYEHLEIKPTSEGGQYLENLISIVEWNFKKDAARINQEVDRDEWFMAPQVVNAYYNPMFNEIVFPAAILQPPFFDWQADAAVNYGGIGAVIGHEITHGFDDQGSRFDKEGNLNEWWTDEDRKRFQELTTRLIQQFDGYFPFDDLPLNGTFTLGENIADLGGLSVAYDALQLYYLRHGKPGDIDGFTSDQRFFMSWATVWRTKTRPEALRHQIKTDPHPPGLYRAVAAPSNINTFYNAFNIHPDSPWYRKQEDRIKIW